MKEALATGKKRGTRGRGSIMVVAGSLGIAMLTELSGMLPEGKVERDSAGLEVAMDAHLDKQPSREARGLKYVRSGWEYDCMECHRSLEAKWHLPEQLMEHRGLELKHGSNRFCLNCHHPGNRNAYVDYDGSEIAEPDVVLLCAKCHGPQHRDWLIGAHGRRNGYWDTSRGVSGRLTCIQCHDPHDPGFKAMKPMAAPTYPERAAGGHVTSQKPHEEEGSHGD